jgi:hypothetical protein
MTTTLAVAYQARIIHGAKTFACRMIVPKEVIARFLTGQLQIIFVIAFVDQTRRLNISPIK